MEIFYKMTKEKILTIYNETCIKQTSEGNKVIKQVILKWSCDEEEKEFDNFEDCIKYLGEVKN